MKLRVILRRRWCVLAVCDDRGECALSAFLTKPQTDAPADHRQAAALLAQVADSGPSRNEEKPRPLSANIFALKTRAGVRIPCFYDEGRVVICTGGLRKPKPKELIAVAGRAHEMRALYFGRWARTEPLPGPAVEGRLSLLSLR
jgi:hypothetical protein